MNGIDFSRWTYGCFGREMVLVIRCEKGQDHAKPGFPL